MSSNKVSALLTCTLPRDARIPSDLAAMTAECPMTLTLRAMGGQARVDRAHAQAIRNLIEQTLAAAKTGAA